MIVTDEKVLRAPCQPVTAAEVKELRAKLEEGLEYCRTMGQPGIGLACPQIGIHKTMAIIRIPQKTQILRLDLVNCQITKKYDKFLFRGEGCLSFPGMEADTYRYQEVVVEDNLVAPQKFVARGMLAVAIQHELDHLRGVLLPDLAV